MDPTQQLLKYFADTNAPQPGQVRVVVKLPEGHRKRTFLASKLSEDLPIAVKCRISFGDCEAAAEDKHSTLDQFVRAIDSLQLSPIGVHEDIVKREFVHPASSINSTKSKRLMLLALPSGVEWIAAFGGESTRFVRSCYHTLFRLLMVFTSPRTYSSRDTDIVRQVVKINGVPRVEKTAFLNYVLVELHHQRPSPTIVLDTADAFALIESDGTVREGDRGQSFLEVLAQPGTLYLFDARPSCPMPLCGPNIKAHTIIISSFAFDASGDSLMRVWTLDVLEQCRASCYREVTTDGNLEALYSKFGGIPRLTLAQLDPAKAELRFQEALKRFTFAGVEDFVRRRGLKDPTVGSMGNPVQLLIRVTSTPESKFTQPYAVFASRAVSRFVIEHMAEAEVLRFLKEFSGATGSALEFGAL